MIDETPQSSKKKDIVYLTASKNEIDVSILIESVTKNPLRIQIFLLLYLNIDKDLNVTEISTKLNKSKATVSRHLKAMFDEGILESGEIQAKGKINPKYYRLPKETLYLLMPSSKSKPVDINLFKDPNLRLDLFKRMLFSAQSMITLATKSMEMIQTTLKGIEEELEEKTAQKTIDDLFLKYKEYFIPRSKLKFNPIPISDKSFKKVNKLYDEFISKVYDIRDESKEKGEPSSIIVMNSLMSLDGFLEFVSYKKEKEEEN